MVGLARSSPHFDNARTITLDTNALVRLIVRDDTVQAEKAEAFVALGARVSQLLLAEPTWVLESMYGLSRVRIATVVGMLVEHDRLTLHGEDAVRRAHAAFEQARSVALCDYLVAEAVRKSGHLPVDTFDKAMPRAEGARGLLSQCHRQEAKP